MMNQNKFLTALAILKFEVNKKNDAGSKPASGRKLFKEGVEPICYVILVYSFIISSEIATPATFHRQW